ncbi:MAG: tetratricopeptide repeat protein, partial [Chitinophagaceae bacterium]|nr:tetratricopeptide repeat protein [Rubrivivax sp.]
MARKMEKRPGRDAVGGRAAGGNLVDPGGIALSLARLGQAEQCLQRGQHAQARPLLELVLSPAPLHAEAQYLLAIGELMKGNAPAALTHARLAVSGNGKDARYAFTLGRSHKAAGDLDAAESSYRQALQLKPDYVEAMVSLGIVLKSRGDADGAIALYDRALQLAPDYAVAHANRANTLALRAAQAADETVDGRPPDEVLQAQAQAVALEPHNAVLRRNHGVLLVRAQQRLAAAEAFNMALSLDPGDVESCLHLGGSLRALGDTQLARAAYEKWLAINPPNAPVMRALAALLTRLGETDEALSLAEKAAALDLDPFALMQIGSTLMQSRRLEEALSYCRRAVDLSAGRPSLYPTLLLGANYLLEDPQDILALHADFGRRVLPAASPPPPWRPRSAGQPLRVGYVSGDFVRHSVSYFVSGLLERHDKSRFDVTLYHNLGWGDSVTQRFKALGHRWVECEGLSDEALKKRVHEDRIDVLIDLSGHTSHSRVSMFALGAAPVQLCYLGYPTVTGVLANHFRITDSAIDPDDVPALAAEQPLRLPRSMFCYRPDEEPAIGPVPAAIVGHVTFGSFNNIAKLSDHTLELWARLMLALPGSRLLLKSSSMAQPANRRNIEQFLSSRGVAPDRLRLQPWNASKSSHLETYNEVDVALDPFPYNGATTTCEALWMGVPVITRS